MKQKKITFQEAHKQFCAEALNRLLTDGGKGLSDVLWCAMNWASMDGIEKSRKQKKRD